MEKNPLTNKHPPPPQKKKKTKSKNNILYFLFAYCLRHYNGTLMFVYIKLYISNN